jgi:hypothetical protein
VVTGWRADIRFLIALSAVAYPGTYRIHYCNRHLDEGARLKDAAETVDKQLSTLCRQLVGSIRAGRGHALGEERIEPGTRR